MPTSDEPNETAEGQPDVVQRMPRFGAGASGLVSLLLVAGLLLVPVFGLLVAPLGLVPVLAYQARGGPGIHAWGWVVALLVAASAFGVGVFATAMLIAYVFVVVVPSLSVELWSRSDWDEARWIAITVAGATGLVMLGLGLATLPAGPVEGVASTMREAAGDAKEMYGAMGFAEGEIELAFDASERVVPWVLPSVIVGYLVLILFWIRPRIPILGFSMEVEPFEEYRSEEWIAAGFALAGLGALFFSGIPRWAALNLLIAVLLLYFVQGLAMIRAHLARWVGRGWFVRWGVAFMCIYPPMPILVATLGVVDSFISLRPRTSDDGGNP